MALASPATAPQGLALTAIALAAIPARRGHTPQVVAVKFRGAEVLQTVGPAAANGLVDAMGPGAAGLPVIAAGSQWIDTAVGIAGLQGPMWDVLELASVVAPRARGESLEEVGAWFGLSREDDDLEGEARLAIGLFDVLTEQVLGVDAAVLAYVNRLMAPVAWGLGSYFLEVERARTSRSRGRSNGSGLPIGPWAMPAHGAPGKRATRGQRVRFDPLDPDSIRSIFEPDGGLSAVLPVYERREEQLRMVDGVAAALNESAQLVVEAGTGTGKSLAYLAPVALYAHQNGQRAVVSTATTTLQDQLFSKDLPNLQEALGTQHRVRATVLKGRANYLCFTRWQAMLESHELDPAERLLLVRTLFWLPGTATGDRAELHLSESEAAAWQRLAAIAEVCTPPRCDFHRAGVCYLARARRAAEESQLIIANHALLLSDLVSGSHVLPDYHVLVVDEAHHLEDEATAQLGWRLGERELTSRLDRLWMPAGTRGGSGIIPEALGLMRHGAPEGGRRAAELAPVLARAERSLLHVRRGIPSLFDRLEDICREYASAPDESGVQVRITSALRGGSAWQEVEALWDSAARWLLDTLHAATEVSARLESLPGLDDAGRALASELAAQIDALQDPRERLVGAIHTPSSDKIYWLTLARHGGVFVNAAPLDVAPTLRDQLFARPNASILSSATLSVDGSFDYVKRRLGVDEARELAVGSPFDYREAALVYAPHDVPDPTQPGYQAMLEEVLADTIGRIGGRTLVLFTSRAHLRASYAALKPRLAKVGVTVLGQGIDEGSRTRLLDVFRRGRSAALFGTSSFWEGVDVVGEALSCVVVARLPFSVPTDPVYAARAEQFEDPFREFAVPQAVLRFKQGFGRLIRSRSDRGAMVVLDRRVVTRMYGRLFVRSLPDCTFQEGPAARTARVVADWLDR